jgi:predicted chitinase
MATLIDRETFFDYVRKSLFPQGMTQGQVDGFNAILAGWEKRYPDGDLRWLAYELATTQWETAHTMQPIEEYGKGSGKKYGVPDPETGETYYGRGYVQLTWKDNYAKMCEPTGCDLVNEPSKALDPETAAIILFHGMEQGSFTGKKNSDYFNEAKTDWVNARQIINGNDHDDEIANLAKQYFCAVQEASYDETEVVADLRAWQKDVENRVSVLEEKFARMADFFADL